MQWFAFRAHNEETMYGWGTEAEADAYADLLSFGRDVDIYAARPLTDTEAAALDLERRPSAVNLDDALRAAEV